SGPPPRRPLPLAGEGGPVAEATGGEGCLKSQRRGRGESPHPTLSRKRERAKLAGAALASRPGSRQPGLAARFREGADAADIGGALGDADDATRVEQVEGMARLDALVVGRQRELRREE